MKSRWNSFPLGTYISEINRRNTFGTDIDVFSITNINGFTKSKEFFNKEVFSKNTVNYKVVHESEFAYNPSRINVGSIDYLKGVERAIVSPMYTVFKVQSDLNNEYLKMFLKSTDGLAQIRKRTTGSVRDTLKFESLETIKIPVPSLDDQIRIAALLSMVEELIVKRRETINLLDDLAKSIFMKMFGNPVKNEKGWERGPIKTFIGNVITGNTPSRANKEYYADKYIEWIKTDNILDNEVNITSAEEYLSNSGMRYGRWVNSDALLVTCIAGSLKSIGTSALTNRRVAFNQQINAIVPFEDVNSLFLYWLFRICKKYIQSHAAEGMKKLITKSEFEEIVMIKPPQILQNQFSQIVDKIEALKKRYQASLTELESLKTSLSQRAFRGKLDVSLIPLDMTVTLLQSAPVNHDEVSENTSELLFTKELLLKAVRSLSGPSFMFEELLKVLERISFKAPIDYDTVRDSLFELLDEPTPVLIQYLEEVDTQELDKESIMKKTKIIKLRVR